VFIECSLQDKLMIANQSSAVFAKGAVFEQVVRVPMPATRAAAGNDK
jgi:hypothetical protein